MGWLKDTYNAGKNAIVGTKDAAVDVGGDIKDAAVDAADSAIDIVTDPGQIISAAGAATGFVIAEGVDLGAGIVESVAVGTIEGVGSVAGGVIDAGGSVVDSTQAVAGAAVGTVASTGFAAAEVVGDVVAPIGEVAGVAGGAIVDGVVAAGGAAAGAAEFVGEGLADTASAAGGAFVEGVATVGEGMGAATEFVADTAVDAGGLAKDAAVAAGGAFVDGAAAVGDAVGLGDPVTAPADPEPEPDAQGEPVQLTAPSGQGVGAAATAAGTVVGAAEVPTEQEGLEEEEDLQNVTGADEPTTATQQGRVVLDSDWNEGETSIEPQDLGAGAATTAAAATVLDSAVPTDTGGEEEDPVDRQDLGGRIGEPIVDTEQPATAAVADNEAFGIGDRIGEAVEGDAAQEAVAAAGGDTSGELLERIDEFGTGTGVAAAAEAVEESFDEADATFGHRAAFDDHEELFEEEPVEEAEDAGLLEGAAAAVSDFVEDAAEAIGDAVESAGDFIEDLFDRE